MVGGPRREDRVAKQQKASHFVPDDGMCRDMSVDESMKMQELKSHGNIAQHPVGLGARQGTLFEHFAQQ